MFGIFKSKVEREQQKADKTYSKMVQEIDASDKINDAITKRESAERARAFQQELDAQQKIIKAGASLTARERETRASLIVALNALKREEAKANPNPIDVQRCRQRVKNYFFKLVTIRRAQRAFEESKLNRQWDRAMNDLSNTFKMMNEVSSGSSSLKKIIFFFRYNKVKKENDAVYNHISDYFGSKAKPLPEDVSIQLEKANPVDLIISDTLFEHLIDAAQIDSCIDDPSIVTTPTESIIDSTVEINHTLELNGEQPVSEIGSQKELNEEDIQRIINEMRY